jgi:hypothetical protein
VVKFGFGVRKLGTKAARRHLTPRHTTIENRRQLQESDSTTTKTTTTAIMSLVSGEKSNFQFIVSCMLFYAIVVFLCVRLSIYSQQHNCDQTKKSANMRPAPSIEHQRRWSVLLQAHRRRYDIQWTERLTNGTGKQKVMYALTKIKGVGKRYSNLVCKKADVDLNKRYAQHHQVKGKETE